MKPSFQRIALLRLFPQSYGDYSVLLFVISDGGGNINNHLSPELQKTISSLPENWTLAFLAPSAVAVSEAKKLGFPAQNIQLWDATSSQGLEECGQIIRNSTDSYMMARSSGIRSIKNLFNLDLSKVSSTKIKSNLKELSPDQYNVYSVHRDSPIKEFVESWEKSYTVGSGYHQLVKSEIIQPYKQLLVVNKSNGKVYGGSEARNLLNLPDYETKVSPTSHPDYQIFLQSTSLNRKLLKGTQLIVLK